MKRVLIISPHFAPVNAADIHRVRQSLPYFREFGWEPVVVAVQPRYVEGFEDRLLLRTIPDDVRVDHVKALDYRWTRLFGLGSLALRSVPFYRRSVNRLLSREPFDLIYFSTTMFPVLSLGPYWKHRFGVPFVVDMQDPWYSDYYLDRPKEERPPKYWLAHQLNKMLEPRTLPYADGVIAVTNAYIDLLRERYSPLREVPAMQIPFGASEQDMMVARSLGERPNVDCSSEIVGVYTGVCNSAMVPAIRLILQALKRGREHYPTIFGRVRLRFIGTSYAPPNRATPTVMPIASEMGLKCCVEEETSRVSYFDALRMQVESDFLVLPGTRDDSYTASKLYPYIMARRPILALFGAQSNVSSILTQTNAGDVVPLGRDDDSEFVERELLKRWRDMIERLPYEPATDWKVFEQYTAREMTRRQVEIFDQVVAR